MQNRISRIFGDNQGSGTPMTIAIVLVIIFLMCGISEYFRLQVIASGVREAVEDAIISVVNDNYAGVYHGVREGYSGGYTSDGKANWEETLNEGDIYRYLDETIGTHIQGGRHIKCVGDENMTMEFAIDSLHVTIRNAPLAPFDPRNAQRCEADAVITESTGRIYRSILEFLKNTKIP